MERILKLVTPIWQRFEDRKQNGKWVRRIYREDNILIVRYYLFSTRWIESIAWPNWLKFLSFNLVIHHMFESDDDGLHDHPWWWASWILSGGYHEHTPLGVFWRCPGHLRFRSAKSLHRLVLDPNNRKGVYSLFLMGPRIRGVWGFLDRNGGWVPWYEHNHNRQQLVQ